MSGTVLVLPGDGIGPEIVAQAVRIIDALREEGALDVAVQHASIGGTAYDEAGDPLPRETLDKAIAADAILLGAVGGPKWDGLERRHRPEQGLLRLRAELGLFANLRPVLAYRQLAAASTLRPEVVADLDIMILRELTGGIYFGQPRGIRQVAAGGEGGPQGSRAPGNEREGFNTLIYKESEIERICRVGFELATQRGGRLCSVDKANVLETSELWREVADTVARDFPDVTLSHMYVDNAAMQLVRDPRQFDVIVTSNMFGDILSDLASMLTGSIGMLPSASVDERKKGLYEPIHGAAPDIAGHSVANPLATVLSLAMLLRHSLGRRDLAERVEAAVQRVLDDGLRTADVMAPGCSQVDTLEMGDALLAALGN